MSFNLSGVTIPLSINSVYSVSVISGAAGTSGASSGAVKIASFSACACLILSSASFLKVESAIFYF
jgi:hypothetical protein